MDAIGPSLLTFEEELCLDTEVFNRSFRVIGTEPGPYSHPEEGDRSGVTIWGDARDLKSWKYQNK